MKIFPSFLLVYFIYVACWGLQSVLADDSPSGDNSSSSSSGKGDSGSSQGGWDEVADGACD